MKNYLLLSFCLINWSVYEITALQKFSLSSTQMRCFLCKTFLAFADILFDQDFITIFYCRSCYEKIRGKKDEALIALVPFSGTVVTTYGTFENDYEEQDFKEYELAKKLIEDDLWELAEEDIQRKKKKKKKLRILVNAQVQTESIHKNQEDAEAQTETLIMKSGKIKRKLFPDVSILYTKKIMAELDNSLDKAAKALTEEKSSY